MIVPRQGPILSLVFGLGSTAPIKPVASVNHKMPKRKDSRFRYSLPCFVPRFHCISEDNVVGKEAVQ